MNNRIKKTRSERGFSQKRLAEMIGISDAAVSKIESGTNNPADRTVKLIADALNVSEHWLRTGEGSPDVESASSAMDALVKERNLSELDRNMLESFLSLSPQQREAFNAFARSMLNISSKE